MQNIPSSLFPRTEGLTFGDLICRDKTHFDSALQKLFSDLVDCHRTTHAISMQNYPGVLPRRQGAPLLVAPWICSVSHKYHRAAVVVGCEKSIVQSVGIDLEVWMSAERAKKIARRVLGRDRDPNLALDGLASFVCGAVSKPNSKFDALLMTIIFSAKEALFKCLFPIVRKPFYFDAARLVRIDFTTRTFCIALTVALSEAFPVGFQMSGSFAVSDSAGNILTDQHIKQHIDLERIDDPRIETGDVLFVSTSLVLF